MQDLFPFFNYCSYCDKVKQYIMVTRPDNWEQNKKTYGNWLSKM